MIYAHQVQTFYFSGICVAQSLKISRTATDQEFDTSVTNLLSINKVNKTGGCLNLMTYSAQHYSKFPMFSGQFRTSGIKCMQIYKNM